MCTPEEYLGWALSPEAARGIKQRKLAYQNMCIERRLRKPNVVEAAPGLYRCYARCYPHRSVVATTVRAAYMAWAHYWKYTL